MNAALPANATSQANVPVLPDRGIEWLFQKFEDFYGAKWAAQYGAFPRERVKRTWAIELGGFSDRSDIIKAALDAQKGSPFPPTLPDFLALCREAAKRSGNRSDTTLKLVEKIDPKQLERNRIRIAEMIGCLKQSGKVVG